MAEWDSEQYLKFEAERTQPAVDLANRIELTAPERILDLGCGPGNSTGVLARRFPGAHILGVDNSENMIATAQRDYPELEFRLFDATGPLSELGGSFDVVYSNACIQWVPDHPALLRRMMDILAPGGVMAVQIPNNFDAPVHRIIREVVAGPEWKPQFPSPRIFHSLPPDDYFDLLAELSDHFHLWQTTYFQRMPSHRALLEWYRGTGLRPYLAALDDVKRPLFEAEILRRIAERYPVRRNGEIIFHFPRLFFTAVRK
ncbi:methyltransferase domain-containing protein [Victivallis lenta]|uniref:methyltransferase domain-containing protein n=1 Tax=Victivallis lenta TaxID=2606640 RepID=UPI003AF272A3